MTPTSEMIDAFWSKVSVLTNGAIWGLEDGLAAVLALFGAPAPSELVAGTAAQKRVYDALAKEGGGTWATYMMMDIEQAFSPPPTDLVEGNELLTTIKEFARWHHLNEVTITAGKTPSDSEIDFEATAWNRITRALATPAKEDSTDV